MATQVKFSISLGQSVNDVVVSSGTTISGGDAIELNMDIDKMTEAQAYAMIEALEAAFVNAKYPAL